jgi:hypothetical protein
MTTPPPPPPDWIHIGSGKSGSTSLAKYLSAHPQLFVSPVKEPRHFVSPDVRPTFRGPSDEERVNRPMVWRSADYDDLFAERQPGQLAGELSQTYLGWPGAPAAVKARNPDTRIVAVLRHPADRAFSSWSAHRRDGFERLRTFEEAAAAEQQRIADGYSPIWWYTERGWYGRFVEDWLEHFPRGHVRVWIYEDMKADPLKLIRELLEFLGVDPTVELDTDKHHNVSMVPRSRRLDELVRTPSALRRTLGKVVPERLHAPLAQKVIGANDRRLVFDPDTRRTLTRRYRPDIERLAELLDRDLSVWLEGT